MRAAAPLGKSTRQTLHGRGRCIVA